MPSGTEIPWWEATAARFSYRNGAPFPKPPVSVTETGPRSSYRNGAPFPKPPVSVTETGPCSTYQNGAPFPKPPVSVTSTFSMQKRHDFTVPV